MMRPPSSGVPGLTPRQVRLAIVGNDWGALPILRHDAGAKGGGKAPVLSGWEEFAAFDADLPTLADLDEWDARFPFAPGTGLPMGNQVALDLDFLRDPGLARRAYEITVGICGETPFVRQGQAPKAALIYRAAEPIETIRLKAADRSGDGIDVLGDGTQLVGFGLHPSTGAPYEWIAAASPLTATPFDAPKITNEQVQAVLQELGRFVELTVGAAPGGKGEGGNQAIVRDEAGRVVDGREGHLANLVFAAAAELHEEGQDLDEATIAARSWAAFEASTVRNGRWTPREALAKARLLLRRVRAGKVDLEGRSRAKATAEALAGEPTYPDRSVPTDKARQEVRKTIRAFLAIGHGHLAERNRSDASAPQHGLRASTGLGKTRLFAEEFAGFRRSNPTSPLAKRPLLYLGPTHRLNREVAEIFEAHGLSAAVWRGRDAPNPANPDEAMCLDLEAVKLAQGLGEPVEQSVCSGKDPNGEKVQCPFYERCAYQRQKAAKPDVWLAAHTMLEHPQSAFGKVGALVVDEDYWAATITPTSNGLTIDEIGAEPPFRADRLAADADLAGLRHQLAQALRAQAEPGGIKREIFADAGITAETCTAAIGAEYALKPKGEIMWPGMPAKARAEVARLAADWRHVRARVGIWAAVRTMLQGNAPVSGRAKVVLKEDRDHGRSTVVRTRTARPISVAWAELPAFVMSATLPRQEILDVHFPISSWQRTSRRPHRMPSFGKSPERQRRAESWQRPRSTA